MQQDLIDSALLHVTSFQGHRPLTGFQVRARLRLR